MIVLSAHKDAYSLVPDLASVLEIVLKPYNSKLQLEKQTLASQGTVNDWKSQLLHYPRRHQYKYHHREEEEIHQTSVAVPY